MPFGSVDLILDYVAEIVQGRVDQELKVRKEKTTIQHTPMSQNIVELDPDTGRVRPPKRGISAVNPRMAQLINSTDGLSFQGENKLISKKTLAKYRESSELMNYCYSYVSPDEIPTLSLAYATDHGMLTILSSTREGSGATELLRARGSSLPARQGGGQAQGQQQGNENVRF